LGLRITADRIAVIHKSQASESFITINDPTNDDDSAAGTEVIIKLPVMYD